VEAEPDLLQVVETLGTPRGFSGRLHGRQQQRNQHTDNRDDDEELD
jgi:hypothetical protein